MSIANFGMSPALLAGMNTTTTKTAALETKTARWALGYADRFALIMAHHSAISAVQLLEATCRGTGQDAAAHMFLAVALERRAASGEWQLSDALLHAADWHRFHARVIGSVRAGSTREAAHASRDRSAAERELVAALRAN